MEVARAHITQRLLEPAGFVCVRVCGGVGLILTFKQIILYHTLVGIYLEVEASVYLNSPPDTPRN